MWKLKFVPAVSLLFFAYFVHTVILQPTNELHLELGHVRADISAGGEGNFVNLRGRAGRCFGTIWNWLRGKAKEGVEKNIISVNPDNVRFFLYPDPYKPDFYQEIVYNDVVTLQQAQYRFGSPWKVLIHGYTMGQNATFPQNVKNAYLDEYRWQLIKSRGREVEGYNVIVVDWGPLADPKMLFSSEDINFLFMYAFAVRNVKVVGHRVGEFVQFLRNNGALQSYNKVHIVGFSLGAHVAGNAGNKILNLTGERVPRVTGLDPAGPNFYLELKEISSPKLSKDNAKFVDVYHSNQGAFGTLMKLGHVDFLNNGGGPVQEFCRTLFKTAPDTAETLALINSCSHNRAPFQFAKSISTKFERMVACACESYELYENGCDCKNQTIFGEYCDPFTRGVYYIDISE